MSPKQERLKEIRAKLKCLSEEERERLIEKIGRIVNIEGRPLSIHNTLLLYYQNIGRSVTVVGGFKQWLKAGRAVTKGEHGSLILFPVGLKDNDGEVEDEGDLKFWSANVFDISQTHEIETA